MIDMTSLSLDTIERIFKEVGLKGVQKIIYCGRTLVINSIDQSHFSLNVEWISEDPINSKEIMMNFDTAPIYYTFKIELNR